MNGDETMDELVSRKRLKRKMLERWENEGGRILAVSEELAENDGSGGRDGGPEGPVRVASLPETEDPTPF